MKNQAGPSRLLTEKETAEVLKVTIFALRRWRQKGHGPSYMRIGYRLIRYRYIDIGDWLETRTFNSTARELQSQDTK